MRSWIFFALLLLLQEAQAQFKADNVKYTNVFPQELCRTLKANPGYVLLDVRSQGEFDDTASASPGLNIGRMKDAAHIDIRQLPARWKELLPYKDKPLFIYCSHSQRSRRASRLLADSGFTKVFNVDGGLTNFYAQGIANDPCAAYAITTAVPYKFVAPAQLAHMADFKQPYFLLDIRSDSAFKSISTEPSINAQGHFDNAVNIPYAKLAGSLAQIPAGKPILIIDEFGNESPLAAKLLIEKGFKNVSILFNGMSEWLDYAVETTSLTPVRWTPGVNYKIISADAFDKTMKSGKAIVLVDARSKPEFTNTSKSYWQNIGQIKNAVNIPAADLGNSTSQLPADKNTTVIVYGFNDQDDIHQVAATLKSQGYNNVAVLRGGIWYLRWASHNLKGKAHLNDWVVNVPPENQ